MTISASELVIRLSANMPTDDTGTSGGAIDPDGRASPLTLASTSSLEVLSSAAGDTTQGVTVTGRNDAGAIISDTVTLNGTTPVAITGSFERVLKIELDADAAGTVTVRIASAGATVDTIAVGERRVQRLFYDSASEASQTIRYEKLFGENTNGTDTLTNAKVDITADPSANYRIGLAASKGDSASVTNRKTAPGGITFSDSGPLDIPTDQLAAGEEIGIWVEQTLAADEAATKSSVTLKLQGSTT